MQLNSISIDDKAVVLKVVANKETDDSNDVVESKITAKEEPLAALTSAWANLSGAFVAIMELPASYTEGLAITRLSIRRTKQGTRSVILHATKQLECRNEFLHKMVCPCVQVEPATDGESGSVQIETELCETILQAIHEAERYLAGERSQTLLNFDQAKAALNATADLGRDVDMFANG